MLNPLRVTLQLVLSQIFFMHFDVVQSRCFAYVRVCMDSFLLLHKLLCDILRLNELDLRVRDFLK